MQNTKHEYVGKTSLARFFSKLQELFATKLEIQEKANLGHTHEVSEIDVHVPLGGLSGTTVEEIITDIDENITSLVDNKADKTHTHAISNITNLQSNLDSKVPDSRTVNGKALSSNINLSAGDVGAYTKSEIDNLELVTVADIDFICGTTYQVARANDSEVTF